MMTTHAYNNTQQGLVHNMRKIGDQISSEIKDMTFEQERAYLDKLLDSSKSVGTKHDLPMLMNNTYLK